SENPSGTRVFENIYPYRMTIARIQAFSQKIEDLTHRLQNTDREIEQSKTRSTRSFKTLHSVLKPRSARNSVYLRDLFPSMPLDQSLAYVNRTGKNRPW
ncbi:hypothetical protein HAX54_004081, partial [Datura stramonium]|nr:hypothetical protein [Datura stramonium]